MRTHIRELEQLEYLKARSGAWGKEYLYELIDGGIGDIGFGLTLVGADALQEPAS